MPNARILSMDQFRGYTVAGMFLVNFLGGFAAIHPVLKHHNTYCSYADTIMPQFFFAVGFALRLVVLRNIDKEGRPAAFRKAVTRCLGLLLLGLIVYHLDGRFRSWSEIEKAGGLVPVLANAFWRSPFQALVHIAVTSLWILPVIAASVRTRILYAVSSGLLHLALSAWFWYDLLHAKRVIDGGPLGFLTWAVPTLAGSLAYDAAVRFAPGAALKLLLRWGVVVMLAGYALACLNQGGSLVPPPFWPPIDKVDLWTMSQRAGSLSYQTFSAGFSLAVYALFIWLCDVKQWTHVIFTTLGQNALAGYLLHMWVDDFVKPFAPRDSPLWWALGSFLIFFYLTYRLVKYLNDRQMFLRL